MSRVADFAALLAAANAQGPFGFELAAGRGTDWQECLERLPRQPVGYAQPHLAYQHAYFSATSNDYANLDTIITWQGKAIGLWPLAFADANGKRLSSHMNGLSGVASPLLHSDLPEKIQKKGARQWLGLLGELGMVAEIDTIVIVGQIDPGPLPAWHRMTMEAGASVHCRHRTQIDLKIPEAAYHGHLRKSFKALINGARRIWTPRLDTTGDLDAFTAFEEFHIQVAGRRTRGADSWQRQYEAIVRGDAFAIYLADGSGQLVGASLFNVSRDEALYAVGVYDRRLFDKPLAHLSLAVAIGHARKCGIKRFILGERPYPGEHPTPTEKELQIGFFKEGFATELILVPYLTVLPAKLCRLLQN